MTTVITFQPVQAPAPVVATGLVQSRPTVFPGQLPSRSPLFALPAGPLYTVFGYGGFWAVQLACLLTTAVMNLIIRDQRFHEELWGNTDKGGALPGYVTLECTDGDQIGVGMGDKKTADTMFGLALTSTDASMQGKKYQLYWYNKSKLGPSDPVVWYAYPDGYSVSDDPQYLTVTAPDKTLTSPQSSQIRIPRGGLTTWLPADLFFQCRLMSDTSKVSNTIEVQLKYFPPS